MSHLNRRNPVSMADRQPSTTNSNFPKNNNASVSTMYHVIPSVPPVSFGESMSVSGLQLDPSTASVQGCKDASKKIIADQTVLLQHQLEHSMKQLQMLCAQINSLQQLMQQNPCPQVLEQYQTVFSQYNLEFSNTLLLNQCIANLQSLSDKESDKEGEGETSAATTIAPPTPVSTTTTAATTSSVGEREVEKTKQSELETIKKRIRGILNKMTRQNFSKLSQEMVEILKVADMASVEKCDEFTCKAQFKALIKLVLKCILDKAVHEPMFTNQYARLCYSLYLYAQHDDMKHKVLRQQLVSLCHSIFKKSRKNADKARFVGIIIMIGQLFRYGLISWNVILSGIFEVLLAARQPLDIEGLCALLKTAGQDFERHHYGELDSVMTQLLKHSHTYDFRTQCMLNEIDQMRRNGWTATATPKETNKRRSSHKKRAHQHQNQNKWRPSVEFVRDVTLPDRTRYPADTLLTKTWEMRNTGSVAWGNNIQLVYFKGHQQLSVQRRYPVRNVGPSQKVQVSATIKTPSEPGRYCTYFRLQTDNSLSGSDKPTYFGPRVWVDIIVD